MCITYKFLQILNFFIKYNEEKFNEYIYKTTVMNTSPWEGKSIGSNDIYYMNFNPKGNKCI